MSFVLRSRKLAAWLLAGLIAFAVITTLVPAGSHAFGSPLFLFVVLLVIAATGVCAAERTRVSWRRWSARGQVLPAERTRLRTSPTGTFEVAPGLSDEAIREAVAVALGRLKMRVQSGPIISEGSRNALGLVGSPLFHWALVGLFLVAGLGQLTRRESTVNLMAGDTVADSAQSYPAAVTAGPWFSGAFTGLDITLLRVERNYVVDGIPRDTAPYLEVSRSGSPLKRQWVYANAPLRAGGLMIHTTDSGRVFAASVRAGTTGPAQRVRVYFPPDSAFSAVQSFDIADPSTGTTVSIRAAAAGQGKAKLTVGEGTRQREHVMAVGDSRQISKGLVLTADRLGTYVKLTVVDDWSVPWLYLMFGLACFGSILSVFVPPRTVTAMIVTPEASASGPAEARTQTRMLHYVVRCPKNDPAFPRQAENALREALTAKQHTSEEDVS